MSEARVAPARPAQAPARATEVDKDAWIDPGCFDGVLVDLDGVMTDTANVHASAWKRMFDEFLRGWSSRYAIAFEPFDTDHDYRNYVDGKPRYDGVASFLKSRHIDMPAGVPSDSPEKETVCALGNRKNGYFLEEIRQRGVSAYPTSVDWVRSIKSRGLSIAVVTASCNGGEVLDAAGITDLFDAQVDGIVARDLTLNGKPRPDTYLEAARLLGVAPHRAVIIEDAAAGVQAGKAGKFGLVVGVSRDGNAALLRQNGADIVVSDLSNLVIGPGNTGRPSATR